MDPAAQAGLKSKTRLTVSASKASCRHTLALGNRHYLY